LWVVLVCVFFFFFFFFFFFLCLGYSLPEIGNKSLNSRVFSNDMIASNILPRSIQAVLFHKLRRQLLTLLVHNKQALVNLVFWPRIKQGKLI
jgi:hypothetical protein